MTIYFVRHGQTDWNLQGRLQGQSDIALNDTGIQQAKEAGLLLKDKRIDQIIASPLQRAFQTAQLINENKLLPVVKDARIMERSFGELEGSYQKEWQPISLWDKGNMHESDHHMEPLKDFFTRVYEFLDEVCASSAEQNILIVSHGGVSIPFACYFDQTKENMDYRKLILKNCEILEVEGKKSVIASRG